MAIVVEIRKTNYEEIRIVFDQYVSKSPKETTRNEMNRALGHLCAHIG